MDTELTDVFTEFIESNNIIEDKNIDTNLVTYVPPSNKNDIIFDTRNSAELQAKREKELVGDTIVIPKIVHKVGIEPYIQGIVTSIHPEWHNLLFRGEGGRLFKYCLAYLNELLDTDNIDMLRPHPANIMAAFRYCHNPDKIKVIIVGQDPYLHAHEACGLSFSVPRHVRIPPSLRNIYSALIKLNLIPKMPEHGDLRGWATQGILLLNTYLTIIPDNSKKQKHSFWEEYTTYIINSIMERNDSLIMLWGNNAQSIKLSYNILKENILTYKHPSPLGAGNDFANCDHFAHPKLKDIKWNPTYNGRIIVLGVDGGCKNNGKNNASAKYGVHVPEIYCGLKNILKTCNLSGVVTSNNVYYTTSGLDFTSEGEYKSTNNRAEFIAMLRGLELVLKWYESHPLSQVPIHIVTDSKLVFNFMTSWIWNNKKEYKNPDLLMALKIMLIKLSTYLIPKEKVYLVNDSSYINKFKGIITEPIKYDPRAMLFHESQCNGQNATDDIWRWNGIVLWHQKSHEPEPLFNTAEEKRAHARWLINKNADLLTSD